MQEGDDGVAYFHLLFERHEIVFAEGGASERLFPGPQASGAMDAQALAEIEGVMPGRINAGLADTLARPCPKGGAKLAQFLQRHTKNNKAIVVPERSMEQMTLAG